METLQTEQKNKWYTLKVLSNFEDRVKNLIEKGLETEPKHKDYFYEVLMPSEIVTTVKQGKKKCTCTEIISRISFCAYEYFR
jgi:transcription antitermination factor NusG